MSVTVAKTAGFCFGVNRAVALVEQQLSLLPAYTLPDGSEVRLFTLGEIIHNAQVVAELRQKGAYPAESIEEVLQIQNSLFSPDEKKKQFQL